ncbi:hypothetical protein ACPFUK_003333 [Vibrio cholerae]
MPTLNPFNTQASPADAGLFYEVYPMAMNIEQRLEQSAKSIEQSSQKAHDFAEKDTTIQTCAGSRDSLPKVSRIWQENFARQFSEQDATFQRQINDQTTEFQNRFALSQQSLPWQAGITISDSLQRYHVGVQGEEGYKEFLPNPVKLPFETAATLADDLSQERWLENGVPNKHWTESKVASALEKALGVNARIWPKDRDLQVGDVIPSAQETADGLPITHIVHNDNVYEMSAVAAGVVTAVGGNAVTIGGNELDLASLNKLKTFSARAYGLSPENNGLLNCKALQRLSRAVKRNNGGRVIFEFGTYRVGAQEFAGATGKGYSYKPEDMFRLNGLTGDLYLDFQACKFEWEDGLKFGSFDPVTGEPIETTLPYYNKDSRADVTWGVVEVNNSLAVYATGSIEIDGRDASRAIGGRWGDKGYQIADYGLRFIGNKIFHAVGVYYCHHLCLDGAYLAGLASDESHSKWDGLTSLYNARQGISVGGGNNIHLNNLVLGYTGLGALNMGAAPGAGIDIEPEFLPLRGLRVTNFKIFPCVGAGIAGDNFNSNEVVFQDGTVANNINTPLYTKISNIVFDRVKFYGMVQPCQPGTNANQDNKGIDNILAYPEFINCEFHNLMPNGAPAFKYPVVLDTVIAKIKNCKIFADIPSGNKKFVVWADKSQVDGLDLTITGSVTEQDWALAYFRNQKGFKNFRLINKTETTENPAITARVEIGGGSRGIIENAYIEKTANGFENVLWGNSYRSAGARAGFAQNVSSDAMQDSLNEYPADKRLAISVEGFSSPAYYGTHDFTSKLVDSNPTTGFYRRGHVIWTKNAGAGQFVGRVTTTEGMAGSTAVFKRFGQIEA